MSVKGRYSVTTGGDPPIQKNGSSRASKPFSVLQYFQGERGNRSIENISSNLRANQDYQELPVYMSPAELGLDYGREDGEEDERETAQDKMKVKMMSLWNNVKYGISSTMRTHFNHEIPIWMLGVCYDFTLCDNLIREGSFGSPLDLPSKSNKTNAIDLFKHDYFSRIWFTYRRDFLKLPGSQMTTDCGWGCMLRSGQMLLSQAFLSHFLGRHWRFHGSQSDKADMIHRMIIKWFADDPNPCTSPFSIHQFVHIGATMGKKPGDWFGPSSVAYILNNALKEAVTGNPLLNNICIYIAQDCTVYIQDVIDLCTKGSAIERVQNALSEKFVSRKSSRCSSIVQLEDGEVSDYELVNEAMQNETYGKAMNGKISQIKSHLISSSLLHNKASSTFNLIDNGISSKAAHSLPVDMYSEDEDVGSVRKTEKWKGVILLIPLRLGGERFNPIYINCVKALFTHSSCIGIIGGRPKHSLYFVGTQEDKLIYMDPHYCQEAVDVRETNFSLGSYHCSMPRKMPITRMDPSCTIGFYCHTKQDFLELCKSGQDFSVPSTQHRGKEYPIFLFAEGSSSSKMASYSERKGEKMLRVRHRYMNEQGIVELEQGAEDFVMI